MRKGMTVIARTIAVLFSIAFVCSSALSIVVANIKPNLLSATTYINALSAEHVYSRLPQIIAEQVMAWINFDPCQADPLMCAGASPEFTGCVRAALGQKRYDFLSKHVGRLSTIEQQNLKSCLDQYAAGLQSQPSGQESKGGLAPFLETLGVTNIETLLSQFVPPDELQKMINDTLIQVFAYLNGQQDTATISLVSIKMHISSPSGLNILLGAIRAQPTCTLQQIEQMTTGFLIGKTDIILCKPPDSVLNMISGEIQDELATLASLIPDQVVLLSPTIGANPGLLGGGLTGSIPSIILIMNIAPAVPLVFLLFITLLVIRSPRDWLHWWGIPLFLSGLLAFGLAFSGSYFFEQAWQNQLVITLPPVLTESLINLAHDLMRAIFHTYLSKVYLSAAIVSVTGLGMWIGSAFFR